MKKVRLFFSLIVIVFFTITNAQGQEVNAKKKKSKKGAKEVAEPKKEDKYGDLIKKCVKYDGLFTLYRDTVTGKTYLNIKEDQLNKEYIYFNHIENAPPRTGYFRGSFGGSKIIRFNKNFERMEILQENTDYFFDPENAISKASLANINTPVLASEKIEVVSNDKKNFLIDGDAIFLSEKFQIVKMPSPPGSPSVLGGLSSSKTKVEKINNYAKNTEVMVSYVYENSSPSMFADAMTDARNITITYQHSILEVPQNDYKPRKDDARVGYFSTQVTDMTSYDAAPYKDMIHRWNLVKKDPKALVSEPVEPITYWIENTTPVEMRPLIKEACERWNEAFEIAGFKNAVVCKIQSDTASWDAGDIRYNVIRWTSSAEPPFGGYGPSFVNPRTGEILGADIMLEWVAISNRLKFDKAFETKGLLTDEKLDFMQQHQMRNPMFCMAGELSAYQGAFGHVMADAMSVGDAMKEEITKQMLYRLVLHEVGHTLGLTHNMRGSTMQSIAEIKNPLVVEKEGLCSSVMEYPAFNYQKNPKEQTLFCDVKVGPYDKWVIEYGYSPEAADDITEQLRLKKITDRSVSPELAYGNDADDMRASGKGIDPDVNIYDLSNDPVAYAIERCELVNSILPTLKDKYTNSNQSYEELLQAYMVVTGEYGNQLRIMTRQIGGVHYDRSYFGQATDKLPLNPVSEDKQRAAMAALKKYAFAPDAFKGNETIYNYLLAQRRGFNHFMESDDPKIHMRVGMMQSECLNHLMHPAVARRIVDSQLYGNTYSLDEFYIELTNSIFEADLKTQVNSFRQLLQIMYVKRLIENLDVKNGQPTAARSMTLSELKRIDQSMATAASPDALTKAHREHVRQLIKDALTR